VEHNSAQQLVESTLSQPFAEERFRHLSINLLEGIDEAKAFNWVSGNYIRDAFKDHVKKYRRLGTYTDPDGRKLDLLIVHLKQPRALERSRATQRNFVAEYLKQRGEKDAALIAYHVDDLTDWRFSFVKMQYREELTEDGCVKIKEEFTPSRRFSFLVGQWEPSHTAQQQLVPLLEEIETPTLDEIEHTFSVERVTKEFYTDYRGLFEQVSEALEMIVEKNVRVREEFTKQSIDTANFAKKLLGQIVFLYFLQKKGWLGVGRDDEGDFEAWGQGPKDFLRKLYDKECADYSNYFDEILEPLFYEALATERADDFYTTFNCRIPFLNGGLFEAINDYNWREVDIRLPNDLIGEILDTFDRYNFTVREDDPLDQEVAVDPEMLGKVFENLLPENLRKGKGSYYTPRNVVHFMCQESLINYLDGAINLGGVSLVSSHKQQRLMDTGNAQQIELQGEGRSVRIPREDLEEFIRRGEFAQEMDLAKAGGPLSYKLEGTKSYSYRVPESIRGHAKPIDQALADLRICDPAVGSGAFLVGMMHEVVKARSVLRTYLDDQSERSPYELKRQCIHNSLYGVDIDPGAVDIAKLRLWLSLVVDEEEYKSIHPLPNLDYKVMQGNSLFEDFHGVTLAVEDEDAVGTLLRRDASLLEKIELLHQTQAEYFDAKHPGEKRRLRAAVEDSILDVFAYSIEKQNSTYYESRVKIRQVAASVASNLREDYLASELRKLRERFELDPDELEAELRELTHGNVPRDFFPWCLYFADVFQEKGGFDIVIANPPYVQMGEIKELKPHLKEVYPEVYGGRVDLYVYFYKAGLNIVRPGGVLTFISSNKFMRSRYGANLRALLSDEKTVLLMIDFGDLPIFDASAYPAILIIRNRCPAEDHRVNVLVVREFEHVNHLAEAVQERSWQQLQTSLGRDGWTLMRPDIIRLIAKLRERGIPLGEFARDHIYRGIVTGLNEAFVIDDAIRERLIEEDPRSADLIKPWVRGRDVKRWDVDHAGLYVIFTYHGVEIDAYPAIRAYLATHRVKLQKRATSMHHAWYELQQPQMGIYKQFETPKIIYPDIATSPRFAHDASGAYLVNTLYFIPGYNPALLGILNSSVVHFYMSATSVSIQNEYLRFFSQYMTQVPIAEEDATWREIASIVNTLQGQDTETQDMEEHIDQLCFELYDLTSAEVATLKSSIKRQEE